MNKVELLAPAGSYKAFEAAIYAGADAVYVGGPAFGARAYADNFTEEELIQAIHMAHIHGRKLYLTVNTLLKNREIKEQLYNLLEPLYLAGLDAVIIQDFGVFRFIKNNFPGLSLHASTQMTITGPLGMKFLEEEGADRVVAARELSLAELSAMHRESPIEIEAFVHGALCYSVSGQCLMSSILGGRSGNRGKCAQPCRLAYQTSQISGKYKKSKEACPLSLKDICTIDLLPEIIEAGVTSLKIEGRMKKPAYTAGVTSVYRKYVDLYLSDPEHYRVEEKDRRYLIDIFNRGGSCEGYFNQHNGPSMMAFTNEKKSSVEPAMPEKKREKISGSLLLNPGEPVKLSIFDENHTAYYESGMVEPAHENPMTEDRIRKQMNKLGNTEFEWQDLEIKLNGDVFVPVSVLNETRRGAIEAYEKLLCEDVRQTREGTALYSSERANQKTSPKLYVSCETKEQMQNLLDLVDIKGYYVNYNVANSIINTDSLQNKELYLMLPHVMRGNVPEDYAEQCRTWLSDGLNGFLVRSLEAYGWLKSMGWEKYAVLDSHLYTWNNESLAFWEEKDVLRVTAPIELNQKELLHRYNNNSEFLLYGYLPLMFSAQCVRKNTIGCDAQNAQMYLRDRYDKEFASVCVCDPWKTGNTIKPRYCYNILYNSIPYGLLKEREQVSALNMNSYRLSFTLESPSEARNIAREFIDVYFKKNSPKNHSFTKGHFKRGAE